MLNKVQRYILVFIASTLLMACSSSGSLTLKQPMTQKINAGKTVALNMAIAPGFEQEDDYQVVKSRGRERLMGKLMSEGIFKSVLLVPEPADYTMDVTVIGARSVSNAARIWFGIMAGHNAAEFEVKLFESNGNRLVTNYNAEGTSAIHPMSSEASLDDAVREAVTNVIIGLKQ